MKEIKLSKNKGIVLVDDEDYDQVSQYKWYSVKGYPTTTIYYGHYVFKNKRIYKRNFITMSRFIMNAPKDKEVDHKDHNLLNNQKSNLRVCTSKQNNQNRLPGKGKKLSKYKGVSWLKQNKCWTAYIVPNKKQKHLGCFKTENEAAIAYNEECKILFGEYGLLNVIT